MHALSINGHQLDWEVSIANTFGSRLLGWMGRTIDGGNRALLLSPCRQIHTFGMRMPIDVLFLDGIGDRLQFAKRNKAAP